MDYAHVHDGRRAEEFSMLVQGWGECVDISQKTACTVCACKRERQANGLLLLWQTYNWGGKMQQQKSSGTLAIL